MLHHLSFAVADLARAGAFYDAVLQALGYRRVWTSDTAVGYGVEDDNDLFAIKQRDDVRVPASGFHLAFAAPSRDAVDRFHAAALAHGGRDQGAPGLRPHYGPNYYAAFALDPDGYWIEAVINTA
ncbi:VOC family protein [Tahibacter caeni]|uniref:VOC family protein n=1 Tax=Tahibacter caeni TaxID=1453545 RepID=UPI002147D43F|nr:VOC family protein [Tahibacter caeni]